MRLFLEGEKEKLLIIRRYMFRNDRLVSCKCRSVANSGNAYGEELDRLLFFIAMISNPLCGEKLVYTRGEV